VGFLDGSILPVLAVPGKPVEPGLFQAGLAGFADGLTAPFVFVVGRDVSDAGVEPYRVVLRPSGGEFGAERGRVADREQVRYSALTWPLRLSSQAWSVGVCGRPKCWAIAHRARNSGGPELLTWRVRS
jgi:hypothetical protein